MGSQGCMVARNVYKNVSGRMADGDVGDLYTRVLTSESQASNTQLDQCLEIAV